MRINNNVMAANAYRNLSNSNNTSGRQAIRNAQDGVSFVQTAEGAMNVVHAILQRMRTLAVSAANSTSDGAVEQAEVGELLAELDAIGARTTFNGYAVFRDYSITGSALTFHIGAGSADTLSVTANLSLASNAVFGTTDLSTVSLTTGAAEAIDTIDTVMASVSTARSALGATQNRLEHAIANVLVAVENLSAAESRICDADIAEETVTFTRNQILRRASTAMLAQANQVPRSGLSLLR